VSAGYDEVSKKWSIETKNTHQKFIYRIILWSPPVKIAKVTFLMFLD
jgi:hypothetical protein